ncbi:MAG: hypothetical protein N2043_01785 [Ignavibacterium sp.]|nr:hypothetical protein [Ignavibacterium sp.]
MPNQYTHPWTPEMDEFLYEYIGQRSYAYIAKKLGRTEKAIIRRAQKLGISNTHLMSGAISANQLALITNVSFKTITRIWIPLGLKAKRKSLNSNKVSQPRYYIYPEDFWKWAEKNKDRVCFSKIQRGVLLPEPTWLDEEIQKEKQKLVNKRAMVRKWTKEEENQLMDLYYKQGKTQREVAQILNRSQRAIEKKISEIAKRKQ